MILSAPEIIRRLDRNCTDGKLIITPYSSDSQQPASYDLRTAVDIHLQKGICTLVPTLEWVELPKDLAGTLRCRSSFGRQGVLLGAGFIDPGFHGQLTLCLTNLGSNEILIRKNERVVQMILHEVRESAQTYSGRYQNSQGAVEAK